MTGRVEVTQEGRNYLIDELRNWCSFLLRRGEYPGLRALLDSTADALGAERARCHRPCHPTGAQPMTDREELAPDLEGLQEAMEYMRTAKPFDYLASLKVKREAINDQIDLVEEGIRKAAYDAEMQRQLVVINETRKEVGKPMLSMSQFASGCFSND